MTQRWQGEIQHVQSMQNVLISCIWAKSNNSTVSKGKLVTRAAALVLLLQYFVVAPDEMWFFLLKTAYKLNVYTATTIVL